MARLLKSPRLLSIHPIQLGLTHYFEHTKGQVSYYKLETERQFQSQQWDGLLTVLPVRNSFYS